MEVARASVLWARTRRLRVNNQMREVFAYLGNGDVVSPNHSTMKVDYIYPERLAPSLELLAPESCLRFDNFPWLEGHRNDRPLIPGEEKAHTAFGGLSSE